ncbi:centromere protein F [Xyrichtys novacula]|uniref:Centromere protein F n=1 Tax=Xyrichtys novacula TaxID=13765 RepID=A0AAV1FCT9_XYRNO|nr:centromere protein F [Xyrichtys novacula]
MSWAEEDWTVGLSGRVLQKVKELQVHQERLSRDNKQKQLQLDNINTSLEKQTAKYEDVRGELQYVQRELQTVQDEAKAAVTTRERLTQELQTKQAQICSFEGQLDAARTLNNKLTQEIKRLEVELEKLQNSSRSADTTLFSTPCWNTTSPWEHNGSRKDEKTGHGGEGQSRAPHIRQRLQFSEVVPLSRQQHKSTPHRHLADQSDTFSTPLAAFPWERDDSQPAARRKAPAPSHPQTPSVDVTSQGQLEQRACGKETDHGTETDKLLSEMRSRVSALEEELSVKAATLKSVQNEMMQSKTELTAKELSIQRARDELSLAHTRMAQESERASGAEQRLKQLQEELKCQRQNAESSRIQHQQRTKELEKQQQRDLMELQKERQCLERQHQQEVNKLSQELQQARTLHNNLQAQADKLSLQKQALDKELDAVKEKLKWTEGQLQESQKKEAQTQAKLMEAVRDSEGVALNLEQSRKRERALEEEGKRLAEERADAFRLLKELQEEKAASASLQQPVQFHPFGPSLSSQPSHTPPSRPSAQIKRQNTANRDERKRVKEETEEEDMDNRREEFTASYPPDREPGEGIDSEHISRDSECLQRAEDRNNRKEEERKSGNEGNMNDRELSTLSHSDAGLCTNNSMTGGDCSLKVSVEKTTSTISEQAKASEDLQRENAALRSELNDVREELQKRLEDLEAQRRAETEARTRLKQLSRKKASQAAEKEEQDKGWRVKLESEKAETEKLRKALAALEIEMNRKNMEKEKKEREEQEEEEENNKTLQDRESEMIELNFQLKKQLTEVKAQLALEREERKREEEERNQMNTDKDVNKELCKKLEELEAELEEVKHCRNRELLEKEKVPVANSPLTYLTLHNDELNSNMVSCDTLLPSPVQHLLFCESTNQRNMLVCQATADLIQEEGSVIDAEGSYLSDEKQTVCVSHEDTRKTLQKDDFSHTDLAKEVERLQTENAKEIERSNQYQVKLEALQRQVTRQTQQLTMAFEKQSQHISGLLTELQEKESALHSQTEELQHYKQEVDALKAVKREGELQRGEESMVKEDEDQKQETEEHLHFDSAKPEKSLGERNLDSTCVITETKCSKDGETTDVVTELLAPQRENQLLKQTVDGFTVLATSAPTLHIDDINQRDTAGKSSDTGDAAVSGSVEQKTPRLPVDINTSDQGERTSKAERDQEAESELQIVHLQQQVMELNMKLRSLSEASKQQAEELAMWRLASQPAPTFDPSNAENQSETQDQISAFRESQSDQQQSDESTQNHAKVQESPGHVTVIRGDELLLSCSSNKLQGRTLFSRLQHSNLPEPKSLQPAKKTATLQDYNQVTTRLNKETEKENLNISILLQSNPCQVQHKERKDSEVIQQQAAKDVLKVPGPSLTKTAESFMRNQETLIEVNKLKTNNDASDKLVRTEMKSVSSQTEESFCPLSALAAPDRHCAFTQTEEEEEEEEESVESPPVSPVLSEEAEVADKSLFSGSFPIPADPARLAERIRRNRTQLSAAFDDTEYEPYGLPEVVMKGFADIPSGPSCPYIVRRGLLGTSVVPAPQKGPEQEETD